MDDKMQLQRMALEEAGMGNWQNLTGNVPVTEKGAVFGSLSHVDPEEPRLGTQWTAKGQNSSTSSVNSSQTVQMQSMPACDPAKFGRRVSTSSRCIRLCQRPRPREGSRSITNRVKYCSVQRDVQKSEHGDGVEPGFERLAYSVELSTIFFRKIPNL